MGQAATQQSGTTQGAGTKPPVSEVPPEGTEGEGGDGTGGANGASAPGEAGGSGSQQTTPPSNQQKPGANGEPDSSKWDDDTRRYIEKLRKEAGERRTTAKDLETKLNASTEQMAAIRKALGIEDKLSPEDELEVVQARMYEAQNDAYLKGIALEKGITHDNYEYFQFLVNKRASELGDDEELSAESLDEIVTEVNKRGNGMSSTSVSGQGSGEGKGAPSTEPPGGTTLEEFVHMNITERSQLFTQNKDLYNRLMAEARRKRMLV